MNKKAFSLIELIIVLVIIAIVAGLGVSGLDKMRTQASSKMLQARLKQLNIAKQQFITEWGRIEAQVTWADPDRDGNTAETTDQERYTLLKRYIERPQNSLAEFAPQGCAIITPLSVWDSYTGTDSTGANITPSE